MFYHFPTIQICQHIVLEFTQKEKLLHLSFDSVVIYKQI